MTIVIDVTFPFGYVHATPWHTHVNQGAVEWPPSPWRLLRALVATWQTRFSDLDSGVVHAVLSALAEPPEIRVAPRTEASIRTYLPSEKHRRGESSPAVDLVIDAFAAVAPGTGVSYRWPVELDSEAADALKLLVEGLPYLGRAESVCDGALRVDDRGDEDAGWIRPRHDSSGRGVRTLVPRLPLDVDGLCVLIRQMRRDRRLHPTGATWVRYEVPEPIRASPVRRGRPAAQRPEAVRFALTGPAPVSVRQTLLVAEVMRRASMSRFDDARHGGPSPILSGKDHASRPLRGHPHAHWLPVDSDGDGLLDGIVAWAPAGFGQAELAALASVNELRFEPSVGSVRRLWVALEITGSVHEVGVDAMTRSSESWRSATPFLPQRHRKRETLESFLHDCVHRELTSRGITTPFTLTLDKETSWGSFRRHRLAERLSRARPGFGLRLRFERPVVGPICIGHLSHFGMGRFMIDGD